MEETVEKTERAEAGAGDASDARDDALPSPLIDLRSGPGAPSIMPVAGAAIAFLRRVSAEFEWQPTIYLELIQALHLRRSEELSARDSACRADAILSRRPALRQEMHDSFCPLEPDGPLVLAALALHGSLPLDLLPAHPATQAQLADAGGRWTVAPPPSWLLDGAAGLARLALPLGKPPGWACKTGCRVLRLSVPAPSAEREAEELVTDLTTYRLTLLSGLHVSATDCRLRFTWPQACLGFSAWWYRPSSHRTCYLLCSVCWGTVHFGGRNRLGAVPPSPSPPSPWRRATRAAAVRGWDSSARVTTAGGSRGAASNSSVSCATCRPASSASPGATSAAWLTASTRRR